MVFFGGLGCPRKVCWVGCFLGGLGVFIAGGWGVLGVLRVPTEGLLGGVFAWGVGFFLVFFLGCWGVHRSVGWGVLGRDCGVFWGVGVSTEGLLGGVFFGGLGCPQKVCWVECFLGGWGVHRSSVGWGVFWGVGCFLGGLGVHKRSVGWGVWGGALGVFGGVRVSTEGLLGGVFLGGLRAPTEGLWGGLF